MPQAVQPGGYSNMYALKLQNDVMTTLMSNPSMATSMLAPSTMMNQADTMIGGSISSMDSMLAMVGISANPMDASSSLTGSGGISPLAGASALTGAQPNLGGVTGTTANPLLGQGLTGQGAPGQSGGDLLGMLQQAETMLMGLQQGNGTNTGTANSLPTSGTLGNSPLANAGALAGAQPSSAGATTKPLMGQGATGQSGGNLLSMLQQAAALLMSRQQNNGGSAASPTTTRATLKADSPPPTETSPTNATNSKPQLDTGPSNSDSNQPQTPPLKHSGKHHHHHHQFHQSNRFSTSA